MTDERFSHIRFLQGESLDNCFVVAEHSFDEDFKDTEYMEWSITHLLKGERILILAGSGEVEGFWVSPTGVIYLIARTEQGYGLHVGHPKANEYIWKLQESVRSETTYARNVWGMSDTEVICWGGGVLSPSTTPDPDLPPVRLDVPTCWIGSGDSWTQYPGPGCVYGMGGRSLDSLIAIGDENLVAYWNGANWKKDLFQPAVDLPVVDLGFVHLSSTGELYTASYNGHVFKRTETGWANIGTQMGHIYGLVEWQGKILIATGYGLHRVEGDTIVVEQPDLDMRRIWAGKTLLWADEVAVHEINSI